MNKESQKNKNMEDFVDAKGVPDVAQGDNKDQTDARPGFNQHPFPSQPIASMMTEQEFQSDHYKMDYPNRGTAIVINNKTFQPNTGLNPRPGTDVDALAMHDLLIDLGFKDSNIVLYNDVTVRDMKACLHKASREDHSNNDCFVCVILSHGAEGYVYGTDNKVSVDELVSYFKGDKCPSLAGKPKVFIIQACKETAKSALDRGAEAQQGLAERRIPTEADFLLAYSVIPGSYEWGKKSDQGSWFIQAILEVFRNNWRRLDVMSMMTRVNRKVAHLFDTKQNQEYLACERRIPCTTCMLTKEMYFPANR